MKKIRNIIVFDTEFVSSKSGSQPVQIAMSSYELIGDKLKKISDFNTYIMLRDGLSLNSYVTKYTGINNEMLIKEGIYLDMAKKLVIEYLLDFNFQDTILLGWSPVNDQRMFNILFNYTEELIDVSNFRWVDLAKTYCHVNNFPFNKAPSLKAACDFYNIEETNYHDALSDCHATAILLQEMLSLYGTKRCLYEISETAVKEKIKKMDVLKVK